MDDIVIVGGGQAAVQSVDTLRREGFAGSITLVTAEVEWPYQRPPLSKAVLASPAALPVRLKPEAFYADKGIDLRRGRSVLAIDRQQQHVQLDDGSALPYDRLLLATGSRVRTLPLAASLPPDRVHHLKTWDDAQRLRAAMRPGARVAVVGGGFIGLEFAAAARKQGLEVTLFEAADRVMARVTRPEVSAHFQRVHVEQGVHLALGCALQRLSMSATGSVQLDTDAGTQEADFLLVGIGVSPDDALARDAGLHCEQGIVVNAACRTSDPHIFAAGDCTSAPRAGHVGLWRLESVDNAVSQGVVAARAMLGQDVALDGVPWFWSDQYDDKLLIIGLSASHDEVVVRGDPDGRSFSLCYLREGRLIAVDCVNRAADSVAARKLVATRAVIDRVKAADVALPLKDCAVAE